jgi:hypothetical protein
LDLFKEVEDFIAKFSSLGEAEAAFLTFICFSSFFADCLSTSPCLLLFGSAVQAISVLRILGCVCRHPLLLAESRVRGLPQELRPTRLICQPDAGLDRLLAALQFSGFAIMDRGLRQISSASAIYIGNAELKSPFAELALSLHVSPTSRWFSQEDEEREISSINKLQNKLLLYRLRNYSKVKSSQFDAPEFSGSTREHARTLGRCVMDAPELQARLIDLLRPRDDAERAEATTRLDAMLVEALVVCCHERKASVHVGEISAVANGILTRTGESIELSPREVGGRLKRLGFRTTRLDSGGRGIYLLKEECARVHAVGRAFGIPSLREGLPACPYCR